MMTQALSLAVGYDNDVLLPQAQTLALALHLPLDSQSYPRLQVTNERLELHIKGFKPLFVDFTQEKITKRHQEGRSQAIIRACAAGPGVRIIDATAGFGKDAAILAGFGASVCMVERNPIVYALLEDGMRRLENQSLLSLQFGDALVYFKNLPPELTPDVIYLDPMHPTRTKSALVKKEMQVLQQIIGEDTDIVELLTQARQTARSRVVVKWPSRLKPVLKPNYSIPGKTIRFDVYTQVPSKC